MTPAAARERQRQTERQRERERGGGEGDVLGDLPAALSSVPGPTRPGDRDEPAPSRHPPPPWEPETPADTAC